MARIDVVMPQMGESITEGTMSRWIKKVGDAVKRDEPIFEISTDKVDAEIPAPNAGVLAEVIVTEGQTVAVGTVVARIETDASAAAAPPVPAAAPAPPAPSPAPVAAAPAPAAPPQVAPTPPPAAKAPAAPASGTDETAEERLKRRSTPLVRKMVEDHNLDLGAIPGSGSAGRVTKQDVLSYLETAPAPTPAAATASVAQPVETAPAVVAPVQTGAATGPVGQPSVPASSPVAAWPGDRVEPWSHIRKLTADHMVLSRRVSAHVNSLIEIDFTHVAGVRQRAKAAFAERSVSLTFLAFIVKAIADNLRKHPIVNAAVSGDNTIYRGDINVGIAVALDWGLIVPVIRHADELSLIGVARAVQDLAERARTKRLKPEDVQKGTFTITNPGGFGTYVGTPIINQPQVAILAIGAIEKRPSVITNSDGGESIGIRTKGMLCLAYDHRVVDGADADKFLADVRRTLHAFPEEKV
jgi:pyruvate dehydrogenase E2 component (dihydrolipoamide acetyltransferase)